jgi:low affinity Fe/Cu permease
MPWCLFFFERAREGHGLPRSRDLAFGAAAIAMLVYAGGIYPLPHTVLLLGVYAFVVAIVERSARPLLVLAALGALGVALAGPKLLPLLDGFKKVPRLIESTEALEPGALVAILTSPKQGFGDRPGHVTPYGWHEWGMYISTAGALILLVGIVFVQGRREAALKAVGVLFFVLGFGAFHPDAPWTLLHKYAPIFRSQHVPSRFLYTAVLVFGIVAAAGIGRFVARHRARAPWLDAAAALAVGVLAYDIAGVSQLPMTQGMWMVPPDDIPRDRGFHFEQEPPFQYKRRDWAGPMYLAMIGNTGVINCYGAPPFDRKGARPVSAADYHGEAWLTGTGSAKVVEWSPNHAVVDVRGAQPGALLVYNMNFDEGWASDAGPVVAHDNALAVQVPGGDAKVTFRYRPPNLAAGFLACALGVGALVALRRREQEGA